MMKIETIFDRFDEDTLTKFLSRSVVDLLKTLDSNSITPEKLSNLIIGHIPVETMMRNPIMRNSIIVSMREEEAEEFANSIGVTEWEDVWYKLIHTRFGKQQIVKSLEFFGKEYAEDETFTKNDHDVIKPGSVLFPHQVSTLKKLRSKLDASPYKVLLHMPTGAGKTITSIWAIIMHLLENPSSLVIWLAYSEELCEQAMSKFQETWSVAGNRKIDTYRFFGSRSLNPLDSTKGGFMVASLLKLLAAAQTDNVFLARLAKRTDFVIIDEAHQSMAKKFNIVIDELSHREDTKLLGLSATPGRTSKKLDPENVKLAKFFSSEKVMLDTNGENPVKFLIRKGYLARPTFNPVPHTLRSLSSRDIKKIQDELDIPADVLEKLSVDTERNMLIIREITRLTKKHKKIIVFAATVGHARDISLALSMKEHNSYYITSKTPYLVRQKILEDYKNNDVGMILCNYGVLTTGFDSPKTSAVVIARPTKSHLLYAQMVGRGIRGEKAGGSKACDISTVADDAIDRLISIGEIFLKWETAWNE